MNTSPLFHPNNCRCVCLQSKDHYFTGCRILSGHVYIHQTFSNSKWKISWARCSSSSAWGLTQVWNERDREGGFLCDALHRVRTLYAGRTVRMVRRPCMLIPNRRLGFMWSGNQLRRGPKRQHHPINFFAKLYRLQFFMYVCGNACFLPVCRIWTKCLHSNSMHRCRCPLERVWPLVGLYFRW